MWSEIFLIVVFAVLDFSWAAVIISKRQAQGFPQQVIPKPSQDSIVFIDNDQPKYGTTCRRTYDDRSGYCLPAYQCAHIFDERKEFGIEINTCYYDGNYPIVCCPPVEQRRPQPQPQPTPQVFQLPQIPQPPPFPQPTPQVFQLQQIPQPPPFPQPVTNQDFDRRTSKLRISEQKCNEYSQYAEQKVSFLPLTLDHDVRELSFSHCDSKTPLIVGGEDAEQGEFPHMALLGWRLPDGSISWKCGGSLISEYYILTAAHCTQAYGNPPSVVRLGAHYLTGESSSNIDIAISQIIPHPSYTNSAFYHDISLIRLANAPRLSSTLRPACLWPHYEVNQPRVIATGWGKTAYGGQKLETLQKVTLDVLDLSVCNNTYDPLDRKLPNGIIGSQFCAGYLEGGKDTCQGDSGGPIQVRLKDNKCSIYIVGITSFGKFCAAANTPGVYTRIHSYLDWIESIAFRN